jgi:hypothetical protein
MADAKKIKPPPPTVLSDRTVRVPQTVGDKDHEGTSVPLSKNRADFRTVEFERLIQQHGKYVIWRKAMLCPCFNSTTGQTELNCDDCDGSGYVYIDPIEARAHMAQFDKTTRIYEKFGMWMEGQAQITIPARYRLHYRDSIQLRDALMPYNELIFKGNRRGIRAKLPTGFDSARYRIENVTRIAYRTTNVDGSCGIAVLEKDYHFSIDKNGWIEWHHQGNTLIPEGTVLSVMYDFKPVYLVVSHPHVTRDDVSGRDSEGFGTSQNQVISLPLQAAVKLDFLVDSNTPEAMPVTGDSGG